MKGKPTLDGDITNRVILIFAHPTSKKKDPILCGIPMKYFLQYGIPETKKGQPWIFVSTQISH